MTFEEVKNLQISNVIASVPAYKDLVKQCLSIASSSTMKDNEVSMWIAAAVEDLNRNSIDVANNLSNGLIQAAIVNYVKANFGYGEDEEKDRANKAYNQLLTNLSLSQNYLLEA